MAFVCWPQPSTAKIPSKYDAKIKSAVENFLPSYPSWLRGKAQLIQESELDPEACSKVGACGIGQFMPGTWADVAKHLGWGTMPPRDDPGFGIEAWGYYEGRLLNNWKSKPGRTLEDRISLGEASYNAGLGNIIDSQERCNNAISYDGIMACLCQITGDNCQETIGYTKRIRLLWRSLEMGQ